MGKVIIKKGDKVQFEIRPNGNKEYAPKVKVTGIVMDVKKFVFGGTKKSIGLRVDVSKSRNYKAMYPKRSTTVININNVVKFAKLISE